MHVRRFSPFDWCLRNILLLNIVLPHAKATSDGRGEHWFTGHEDVRSYIKETRRIKNWSLAGVYISRQRVLFDYLNPAFTQKPFTEEVKTNFRHKNNNDNNTRFEIIFEIHMGLRNSPICLEGYMDIKALVWRLDNSKQCPEHLFDKVRVFVSLRTGACTLNHFQQHSLP